MGFRNIPKEIKIAAIRLYQANLLPLPVICDFLSLSRATFYHCFALWLQTGSPVRHMNGVRGRPRRFHFSDVEYLTWIIQHRPDWFLDELAHLLETNRFVTAHFTTVHRELVRAGISHKKIKKIAAERNEDLRADYIGCMAQYLPEQLGFLDEVSKDERTAFRQQGRSRKGTRAPIKGVFVRGRRFSAEGLLTIDGMISSTVVEGSMTREMFLQYLENSVVGIPFFVIVKG